MKSIVGLRDIHLTAAAQTRGGVALSSLRASSRCEDSSWLIPTHEAKNPRSSWVSLIGDAGTGLGSAECDCAHDAVYRWAGFRNWQRPPACDLHHGTSEPLRRCRALASANDHDDLRPLLSYGGAGCRLSFAKSGPRMTGTRKTGRAVSTITVNSYGDEGPWLLNNTSERTYTSSLSMMQLGWQSADGIRPADLFPDIDSYHHPRGWHRRDGIRDRSSCWQTGRRRPQSRSGLADRVVIVDKYRWSVGMT